LSVNVGNRKLSRIEVIFQAIKLHEALEDLSLRSFGIRSRNAPLRRKYEIAAKITGDKERIDALINDKSTRLLQYADDVLAYVNAANSIFPRNGYDFELKQRIEYQNKALATCNMIEKLLNSIADLFDADINCFRTTIKILDNEKHLIIEWRKKDRQKLKGHSLH
jgi:hypothetical protein